VNKAKAKYLLKLIVSLSIIIVILTQINWHDFMGSIRRANVALLLLAFLLLFVERVWAVFKWRELLRVHDFQVSLWGLFCIYSIGAFWGLFLPSSLSTDVVRGYYLSRKISDMAMSAASVVVDRMMGLFSLLFVCGVSILLADDLFDHSVTSSILPFSVVSITGAVLAFQEGIPDFLEQKVSFFSRNSMGRKMLKIHRAFHSFKQYPGAMVKAFLYSLVLQVIRVVTIYVTALAFSLEVELGKVFLVVPVSVIIIMLPLSVGGLGVREGSFVALFALVGVSVNDSFIIAGTNSIMVTFIVLFGGLIFLMYRSELEREKYSGKVIHDYPAKSRRRSKKSEAI
jgi:uncharacterized protein (TIRG00374 family)